MSLASLEFLNRVSTSLNNCATKALEEKEAPYYIGVAATTKLMSELIEHEIDLERGAVKPPRSIDEILKGVDNEDVE